MSATTATSSQVPRKQALPPRELSKWLQLMMSMTCNTMAFSITPYFASDAKHEFFLQETAIGLVFAAFPVGYMISCALMSLANISHLRLSTLTVAIRVLIVVFVFFSAMFGLTPDALYHPQNPPVNRQAAVGLHYTLIFGSLRFLQGFSVAALDVLILLYLTKLFPEQVSAVVGQKEAVMGLGVVFGPPLGGALYKVGGFCAPPLVTGGIVLAITFATYVALVRSPALQELHSLREVPWHTISGLPAAKGDRDKRNADASTDAETTSLLTRSAAADGHSTSVSFLADETEEADRVVGRPTADDAMPGNITGGEREGLLEPAVSIPRITIRNVLDLFGRLPLSATIGPFSIMVLSIACFAFLESMVPLYALDTYGVEAWGIGLTMCGAAILYAVVAVITGTCVSHNLRPWVLTVASIVLACGMFLMAPSFHVVFEGAPTTITHGYAITVVGILVCCSAMATIAVLAVAMLVDEAKATSKVLVPTAAAVASLGMSLGGLLGPVVGSAIAEAYGFPVAFFCFSVAAVVLGAHFVLLLFVSGRGVPSS